MMSPFPSCTQAHQKQRRRTTQMVPMPFAGRQAASTMLLVKIGLVAGRGVDNGRVVWQKLAFATVSPQSPCHDDAWAWLDGAWDEAAGCCWTEHTQTLTTFSMDWIQTCLTCLFLNLLLLLLLLLQLLHAHRPPTSLPVPQKQIPRKEVPPSVPLFPHPPPLPRTSVRYC